VCAGEAISGVEAIIVGVIDIHHAIKWVKWAQYRVFLQKVEEVFKPK
jgi:hypothetical protein